MAYLTSCNLLFCFAHAVSLSGNTEHRQNRYNVSWVVFAGHLWHLLHILGPEFHHVPHHYQS